MPTEPSSTHSAGRTGPVVSIGTGARFTVQPRLPSGWSRSNCAAIAVAQALRLLERDAGFQPRDDAKPAIAAAYLGRVNLERYIKVRLPVEELEVGRCDADDSVRLILEKDLLSDGEGSPP